MEGKIIRRVGQRLAMSWAGLVMCTAVSGHDGPSTTPDKQPPDKTDLAFGRSVEALPDGEIKVLTALVIGVEGLAQWRPSDNDDWQPAEVNDLLDPGAQIRTASYSSITLRAGNATVMVCRSTLVELAELLLDGDVLYTLVALGHGRIDLTLDQVGLTNDFKVLTPTEMLAVEGTGVAVTWGALRGVEIQSDSRDDYRRVDFSRMGLGGTFALVSGFPPLPPPSPPPAAPPPPPPDGDGGGGNGILSQLKPSPPADN